MASPPIRLIGIDVDGTLVGASGEVPARVWRAAKRARAQGIRLVLCSGRPAFGLTLDLAHEVDADGWHVFQNGASIVHLQSRESLSTILPLPSKEEVIRFARTSGHVLELYSDSAYVTESRSERARAHAELLGVAFDPRPYESLQDDVVRAQWLVSEADIPDVVAGTPNDLEVARSSSPLMPDTRFIGLTRSGANKGTAIRTVAAKYGIDLTEVMYVGDSGNDLAALRIVGRAVAMANADADVLAATPHRAPHVDEGGLADAIETILEEL